MAFNAQIDRLRNALVESLFCSVPIRCAYFILNDNYIFL